jgi:TRAP transporter TAXI family solute receptor
MRLPEHVKEHIRIYGAIAAVLALVGAYLGRHVRPLPPNSLVIAAGAAGGVYDDTAKRYRDLLRREGGIELKIVNTRGSVENLQLLRAEPRRVDIAMVQGGVGASAEDEGLESLGGIFYEPVFIFARKELGVQRIGELRGRRVAIGPEGSGTRVLALQLAEANGFDKSGNLLLPLAGNEAREALARGEIDAAVFVIAYPLPSLASLFDNPDLTLLRFARTEAYTMWFPFLSAVSLPAGSVSLARDIPVDDVPLVAPIAQLVVRDDVHPALKNLMARIVKEVHGPRQLFAPAGRFPTADLSDYPINAYAKRLYESGPSVFTRFLPFWIAVWGERLLILVLPLLGLALPLIRIAPPIYRWRIQRRIYRWYKHLLRIEGDAHAADVSKRETLASELDALEQRIRRVKVPASYSNQLYDLKLHIGFVRGLLR